MAIIFFNALSVKTGRTLSLPKINVFEKTHDRQCIACMTKIIGAVVSELGLSLNLLPTQDVGCKLTSYDSW